MKKGDRMRKGEREGIKRKERKNERTKRIDSQSRMRRSAKLKKQNTIIKA